MIIFYDIPAKQPNRPWSPNTWKIRYALNFKKLPYKTEWVEMPDVESHCKSLGLPPTGKWSDGRPFYSLPAIYDPKTNTHVVDSVPIALYLDQTYPDAPPVLPYNTVSLQSAFSDAFDYALLPFWLFIMPWTPDILSERAAEYFVQSREKAWGKPIEQAKPTGEAGEERWKKVQDGFGKVKKWYDEDGKGRLFVMGGEKPTYIDMVVAAHFIWLKEVRGEGCREWKEIQEWNDGHWKRLLDALEEYTAVD